MTLVTPSHQSAPDNYASRPPLILRAAHADPLEPADTFSFSDAATLVLAKLPDGMIKITSQSLPQELEPAAPLCFSDVATVVLAKPPDGKVKITSNNLSEEKALQRDEVLEVPFLDGRNPPRAERPGIRTLAIRRSRPMTRAALGKRVIN